MDNANLPVEPALDGLALKRAIDALCDRFEEAWARGERPSIESYLGSFAVADRPQLFRELLASELAASRPVDSYAARDQYLARFPEYRDIAAQVFKDLLVERAAQATIGLSNSDRELVQAVQARLRGNSGNFDQTSDCYPATPRENRSASCSWDAALRPADELWGLLILHAQVNRAEPAATAECSVRLEAAARQLLGAFPELRRRILQSLLLGCDIQEAAARHAVTERTVAMTYRAAAGLLSDR